MTYKADRRLYHNADRSKVVEEGDEEAAYLVAAEGQELPDAEAKRLGLDKVKPRTEVIEMKQIKGPPEDKGAPAEQPAAPPDAPAGRAPRRTT